MLRTYSLLSESSGNVVEFPEELSELIKHPTNLFSPFLVFYLFSLFCSFRCLIQFPMLNVSLSHPCSTSNSTLWLVLLSLNLIPGRLLHVLILRGFPNVAFIAPGCLWRLSKGKATLSNHLYFYISLSLEILVLIFHCFAQIGFFLCNLSQYLSFSALLLEFFLLLLFLSNIFWFISLSDLLQISSTDIFYRYPNTVLRYHLTPVCLCLSLSLFLSYSLSLSLGLYLSFSQCIFLNLAIPLTVFLNIHMSELKFQFMLKTFNGFTHYIFF